MKKCKIECRPGPLSYNEYYTMKYHCRQNLPPCKPPDWYSTCPKPCPKPCDSPCSTPCDRPCDSPCNRPCDRPCDTPCDTPCESHYLPICVKDIMACK